MDWRHDAICRDEDPELFFPIGTSGPALLQVEQAKAVCRRCSVVDDCLQWALETGQDAGVWGGMSEDERRALKRRNARTRAHARFDPLWQDGEWSRKQAYAWLAGALGIEPEDCHIGMFDKATAMRVVEVCDTLPRPQPEWVRKLLEDKP